MDERRTIIKIGQLKATTTIKLQILQILENAFELTNYSFSLNYKIFWLFRYYFCYVFRHSIYLSAWSSIFRKNKTFYI